MSRSDRYRSTPIFKNVKPPIHDATKLHATVACNFVASCMLNFPCNKVANNIIACNFVAPCMLIVARNIVACNMLHGN